MRKKIACGCKIIHNIRVPAGFCFDPSDQVLIHFYLKIKNSNIQQPDDDYVHKIVKEVDFYAQSPDKLAEMYNINRGETHYFFTRFNRKYMNGDKVDRWAEDGYWKISGSVTHVKDDKDVIGFKRSLNFFRGKPSRGEKTKWMMQEFVLENPIKKIRDPKKLDGWALCKLYVKDDPKSNNNEKEDEAQTISGRGSKFETEFDASDSDVTASSNIEQPYELSSNNINPGVDNILGYEPNINDEIERYKQTQLYDASRLDESNHARMNSPSRCDLPVGAGVGSHEYPSQPSPHLVDSVLGFAFEPQEDRFNELINPLQDFRYHPVAFHSDADLLHPICDQVENTCDELSDTNLCQPIYDEILDWDLFDQENNKKPPF